MRQAGFSGKLLLSAEVSFASFLAMLLFGCASNAPAPVVEHGARIESRAAPSPALASPSASSASDLYSVKKGDTLFSIALDHGQSYRDIAAWNNLDDPNKIQIGQQLHVAPPGKESDMPVAVSKPVSIAGPVESTESASRGTVAASAAGTDMFKREPKGGKQPYSAEALAKMQKPETAPALETKPETSKTAQEKNAEKPLPAPSGDDAIDWAWPAVGKPIGNFNESGGKGLENKGIDIAGKLGEPVLAAASGKVILVSSALRGYGNFVIIKHNASFLSVYAHNSRILVKEEQSVSKGQKIAEIGISDSDQPKLHFEIRRQGKPVDPTKFLPAR